MSEARHPEPIQIGLVSDQPIRLEGLVTVFDQPAAEGSVQLVPIIGTLQEMLSLQALEYLVVDMDSSPGGLAMLDSIRRARPTLRLIVIGPDGNDELVLESIIAGARAYLDMTSDIETVRQDVDVVTGGSIWAPRRLLSKLIDRLLKVPDGNIANGPVHLTDREKQVLELILQARSNREIARQLGIEERTVKAHVGRLMRKTGADNRIELTMRAMNRPLTPHGSPNAESHSNNPVRGRSKGVD
jgi:DNA-binding NarL/FixJ family response regulator